MIGGLLKSLSNPWSILGVNVHMILVNHCNLDTVALGRRDVVSILSKSVKLVLWQSDVLGLPAEPRSPELLTMVGNISLLNIG